MEIWKFRSDNPHYLSSGQTDSQGAASNCQFILRRDLRSLVDASRKKPISRQTESKVESSFSSCVYFMRVCLSTALRSHDDFEIQYVTILRALAVTQLRQLVARRETESVKKSLTLLFLNIT